MLSTTSYIFSNDTDATNFRRVVRRQVAHRVEHAVPGSGASAQEVQRAYLAYMRSQQQTRGLETDAAEQQEVTPPPAYSETTNDEVLPPYSAATVSEPHHQHSPTAQLGSLLYSNICSQPRPPRYEESVHPPPYYQQLASTSAPPPHSSQLPHQTINA
ncbi:unnamed protein product [Aureobasidium vineae]|uniref:Uncharacterized protein n=1 Tax=Aureobasidium vineae TaxID=2773715 RepID=A0A9N8P7I5_9PEZI|nr:unnamed protein product [Aureobasidium vineae]